MAVTLVPIDEVDPNTEAAEPDETFVRSRLGHGVRPEEVIRELERQGKSSHDAQRAVRDAIRGDRNRR